MILDSRVRTNPTGRSSSALCPIAAALSSKSRNAFKPPRGAKSRLGSAFSVAPLLGFGLSLCAATDAYDSRKIARELVG